MDYERLDAAARRVIGLLSAEHAMSVRDLAARVVTEQFCTCVTSAEDAVEDDLSAIHASLIDAVVRRTLVLVALARLPAGVPVVVDLASAQSNPPPGPSNPRGNGR